MGSTSVAGFRSSEMYKLLKIFPSIHYYLASSSVLKCWPLLLGSKRIPGDENSMGTSRVLWILLFQMKQKQKLFTPQFMTLWPISLQYFWPIVLNLEQWLCTDRTQRCCCPHWLDRKAGSFQTLNLCSFLLVNHCQEQLSLFFFRPFISTAHLYSFAP